MSQRIPLNQNRRVTGTTEILELCKDMLRLEHGIGNDFDMDTAEFTEFRAQFLADFAQIPYMTLEEENFAKNFARFINEANVIEINELFQRANRDIGQNANAKIVFYDMALKLIVLLLKK